MQRHHHFAHGDRNSALRRANRLRQRQGIDESRQGERVQLWLFPIVAAGLALLPSGNVERRHTRCS